MGRLFEMIYRDQIFLLQPAKECSVVLEETTGMRMKRSHESLRKLKFLVKMVV